MPNSHILAYCFWALIMCTSYTLFAQIPTVQDCLGAIVVCQEEYFESEAPTGQGNYTNEVHFGVSCMSSENNSTWYTFTVNDSGNFGFMLTPNNDGDDYDWALFDITNATCEQVKTIGMELLVSCNSAGGGICDAATGANGGTEYHLQGAGCSTFPPNINGGFSPENELLPVQQGNTYVLVVTNWTGSPFGYTIDFGVSDVGIFDFSKPEVDQYIDPFTCTGRFIQVDFTENVLCESIDPDNFSLTGPNGTETITVLSNLCDVGASYTRDLTIRIDPGLQATGDYTLSYCCITDACGNEMDPQSYTFFFEYFPDPSVTMGPDTMICGHETYTISLTDIIGDITWEDGSTATSLDVNTSGMYTVTVSNDCGAISEMVSVSFVDLPIADLGDDQILCAGDIILLDLTQESSTFEWQDGTVNPSFLVQEGGTYSVTVSNVCDTASDTLIVTPIPTIESAIPDSSYLCDPPIAVSINEHSSFTYVWQDGSTAPSLEINEGGNYSVMVESPCELFEANFSILDCEKEQLFTPNIFAPNTTDANSIFKFHASNPILRFDLKIYDRWGNLVYASTDWETHGWDGQLNGQDLLAGVYVFSVDYDLTINGSFESRQLSGDITLIR